MTRKEAQFVERLERRRDHLADRIKNRESGSPSHDRAELSATNWALRVIQHAEAHGILHDLGSVTR